MARPRETAPVPVGLGAVLSTVLAGPGGAAMGGFFGGAAATVPVRLEDALQRKLLQHGLQYVRLRRASMDEIHVLCRDPQGHYWPIVAALPRSAVPLAGDELDDALYDAAVLKITEFVAARGPA